MLLLVWGEVLPIRLAVFSRCAAHIMFEIAAERGGVGKVEGGGNLLDAHVGVYEIVLAEVHGEEIDPLQGGLARLFLDDGGEVVGRRMQLLGIVCHGTLLVAVAQHEHEEVAHGVFVLALLRWRVGLVGQEGGGHLDEQGTAQETVAVCGEVAHDAVGRASCGRYLT